MAVVLRQMTENPIHIKIKFLRENSLVSIDMSPRRSTDSTVAPSASNDRGRSGPALSRRAVIAAGGTAALVSLAGCSAIVNSLGEMALKDVNIFSGADRSVSGTIELVDPNGEVVLEETFDLQQQSDSSENQENNDGTARYGDVWTDAGDYEASVELDVSLANDSNSTASNESTGNASDAGTDTGNESADNSSTAETGAAETGGGTSAAETVTVANPEEEHLVVGIDQDGTDALIGFHVIEKLSDLESGPE